MAQVAEPEPQDGGLYENLVLAEIFSNVCGRGPRTCCERERSVVSGSSG